MDLVSDQNKDGAGSSGPPAVRSFCTVSWTGGVSGDPSSAAGDGLLLAEEEKEPKLLAASHFLSL